MQIGPAHYVQKWFQGVDASPTEQGRSLTHGETLKRAAEDYVHDALQTMVPFDLSAERRAALQSSGRLEQVEELICSDIFMSAAYGDLAAYHHYLEEVMVVAYDMREGLLFGNDLEGEIATLGQRAMAVRRRFVQGGMLLYPAIGLMGKLARAVLNSAAPELKAELEKAGRPVTPELAATLRAIEERVGRDLSALLSREGADIVYEALEDRGAESVAQSLDLCGALAGLALDSNLPEIAGFELPAGSGDWGVAAPATGAQSADLVRDLAALVESTLAELRAASGQRPVFCDIASVPGGYPVAENTEALEIFTNDARLLRHIALAWPRREAPVPLCDIAEAVSRTAALLDPKLEADLEPLHLVFVHSLETLAEQMAMAKVQAELVEHDERLGAHDERLGTHDEQLGAHGQLLARILGELDSVAPGARARLLRSGGTMLPKQPSRKAQLQGGSANNSESVQLPAGRGGSLGRTGSGMAGGGGTGGRVGGRGRRGMAGCGGTGGRVGGRGGHGGGRSGKAPPAEPALVDGRGRGGRGRGRGRNSSGPVQHPQACSQ